MADVVKAVRIERMGRDVYIMGAANVGKSAFVRYMPSLLWPVALFSHIAVYMALAANERSMPSTP